MSNFLGIPVRYNENTMTHEKAVHYAALISDFMQVSRKIIGKEMKDVMQGDGDISNIRMRTAKGTEFIITADNEFTMCCIQDCTGNNSVPTGEVEKEEE